MDNIFVYIDLGLLVFEIILLIIFSIKGFKKIHFIPVLLLFFIQIGIVVLFALNDREYYKQPKGCRGGGAKCSQAYDCSEPDKDGKATCKYLGINDEVCTVVCSDKN